MKIAVAQINSIVGDLRHNVEKILAFASRARDAGAALMVAPELSLCGYPPEDLLLRHDFRRACNEALEALTEQAHGVVLVVGHPHAVDGEVYNAASVLRDGAVVATYLKHRLPNYTVFDEERYFTPGGEPCVFDLEGVRFGLNICADIWEGDAPLHAHQAGAQVLLVLNASPYHINKQVSRYEAIRERAGRTGMAVVYANLVGGQDELVFDGASFVMDARCRLTHQFASFAEVLGMVELDGARLLPGEIVPPRTTEAEVYDALCLGVRDYVGKNGFPGVIVGLSGGIDSALTLAVAADALGPERVRALMMPSQYTAEISLLDARAMAAGLGVRYDEIPITPIFDTFLASLAAEFEGLPRDTTEENIQARVRGTLLMALSNKYGAIVLTTGNKSEMSVGYCTLYGDMAGGFSVLKDISKTMVYRLCAWRNGISPVIPQRIITRPPSAELRPDQTDQDTLPPYDVLDSIMEAFVEYDMSPQEIIAAGYAEEDVRRVVKMIKLAEYKRRQAPIGVRITHRGFGKDWRFPVTNRFW